MDEKSKLYELLDRYDNLAANPSDAYMDVMDCLYMLNSLAEDKEQMNEYQLDKLKESKDVLGAIGIAKGYLRTLRTIMREYYGIRAYMLICAKYQLKNELKVHGEEFADLVNDFNDYVSYENEEQNHGTEEEK